METLGCPIPNDTPHAVSVSLPSWKATVGYEEGEEWVISKMKTGYPRFFVHESIKKLSQAVIKKYGHRGEAAMFFPTLKTATTCIDFLKTHGPPTHQLQIIEMSRSSGNAETMTSMFSDLFAVVFPEEIWQLAKAVWQHTGDGISSRRAEFCQRELDNGFLQKKASSEVNGLEHSRRGPRRYQRKSRDESALSLDDTVFQSQKLDIVNLSEDNESSQFVEERFGRNLDLSFVEGAKIAMRRRIAGSLRPNELDKLGGNSIERVSEEDVYLYPCGMSAIFNTHKTLLSTLGTKKSACYGFPYVDTLKILQKWGPGCHLYGHGSAAELHSLEELLKEGERILALFCEFPSNPLLKSPNLKEIRRLANEYDFAVVVDETIGTMVNVDVLPYADVVVSSLTKIFSGDSNVMGGCLILNPKGRYYHNLKEVMHAEYEDNHWAEDSIFLERNSRDFISRVQRTNANAEAICELLREHPKVKALYYPKYSPTKEHYDNCRRPNGGYGGLFSVTFSNLERASTFFDTLEIAKGPSLGTNFTLSSPYTILAHYNELDWAREYGVDTYLVRVSVGLEDTKVLVYAFQQALESLEKVN